MTEDEIIEIPVVPDPAPDVPAPTPAPPPPVEVITVEDLLDRLTQTAEPLPSETPAPEETGPVEFIDPGPMEILGMDALLERIEVIEQAVTAPAMTKPFEEYTATEALLLLVFVLALVSACIKLLKGGFSWLLW